MIYTIEVPDPINAEPGYQDFFQWLETTDDGAEFLSECFAGNISASQARTAIRKYGLPFKPIWGAVIACYFNDHPIIEDEKS